jgi:hypothetical protein
MADMLGETFAVEQSKKQKLKPIACMIDVVSLLPRSTIDRHSVTIYLHVIALCEIATQKLAVARPRGGGRVEGR